MARRRRAAGGSSLDLLLDTICNTFGGVVFISILIVVLLSDTSDVVPQEVPDPEQQRALREAQLELNEQKAELERLKDSVTFLSQGASDNEAKAISAMVETLQKAEQSLIDLNLERAKLLSELSQDQEATNEQLQQRQEMMQKKLAVEKKLRRISAQIKNEKKRRQQEVRPRRAQSTSKQQVGAALKAGKIYFRVLPKADGRLHNTGAFLEQSDNQGVYLEPNPSGGQPVLAEGRNLSIKKMLAQIDRDNYYVGIVVFPDSFSEFRAINKLLLEKKLEYHLIPMSDDQKIRIGPSPGVETQGQ